MFFFHSLRDAWKFSASLQINKACTRSVLLAIGTWALVLLYNTHHDWEKDNHSLEKKKVPCFDLFRGKTTVFLTFSL